MSLKATLYTTVLALGLLSWAGPVTAATPLDDLVEVGSGQMRWFGMEIYDARLLNGGGAVGEATEAGPVALEITYLRSISSERLVRTTAREWRRLDRELGLPDQSRVENWLTQLQAIWPNVAPGDQIIAIAQPDGTTHFHGAGGPLGVVDDPAFGAAFLGIWLHPDTRAPDLRAALIGDRQ